MTPRQFLVFSAGVIARREQMSAHDALEQASAEGRTCNAGTYGAQARTYYLNCSERALERLIAAVEREARND